MKYCPSCQTVYADDDLRFCLQDGTGLRDYEDNAPAPTVDYSERETVVRQKSTTFDLQPSRPTREDAQVGSEAKNKNILAAIVVTAIVMCLVFGGIFAAWKMLGGKSAREKADINISTPTKNKTPAATRTPDADERWQPMDYNASLTGTNLTYYRGTTPEQCKADCDQNSKCRGFTLIRAGAYNKDDPPMCYLASEVTGSTASPCCISGIKK